MILDEYLNQSLDSLIFNLRHYHTKLYIACQALNRLPLKYRMCIDYLFVLDGKNKRLRDHLPNQEILPNKKRFLINMETNHILLLPNQFF